VSGGWSFTDGSGRLKTSGDMGPAGGGIPIPYRFSTTTTDSDPGNGYLRLSNATQNAATTIRADLLASDATDWTSVLASFADSSNNVKGYIRLFKTADPSQWLLFTVSAVASPSGYKNVTVANVGSSSASPFADGDAITLSFERVGDQGAQGETGAGSSDGWINDTAETWTYASGSGGGVATFTVTGDQTAKYTVGSRIKLTQSATVKYFVVTAVSVASGTTTVTIFAGSDYTLANSAISANYHSYVVNPQGYPDWFTYNCAPTGFSGTPTQRSSRFAVHARTCHAYVDITGTSNATTFTFSLPIAAQRSFEAWAAQGTNNGANPTSPFLAGLGSAPTSTATVNTNWQGAAWTASGTKGVQVSMTYEI
jgi:hypothetical protein